MNSICSNIEMILHYKDITYNSNSIIYFNCEDVLNSSKNCCLWFDKFIELYKQEIHLPCTGNIRFDILTEDTVRRMKEAGFYPNATADSYNTEGAAPTIPCLGLNYASSISSASRPTK